MPDPLIWIALGFALLNGMNDGPAVLSAGLRVRTVVPPGAWLLVLSLAVATVPLVVSTAVATTLAQRMVDFQGEQIPDGVVPVTVAVAVLGAVVVVAVLASRGLPTSLTLALVGGLTGAGVGAGLPVRWPVVALVLAAGIAAPLVGGLVAYGLARAGAGLSSRADWTRRIVAGHSVAFVAQSVAYAANDGQKILAVYAVAAGVGPADVGVGQLLGLGLLFAIGVLFGVRRVSRTLGTEIMRVRPANAVVAELSSASAVLGSAAFGAPVSMVQSVSGALVGVGVSESYRRVRWRVAGQVSLAWVLTLPASLVLTAVAALALVAGS